MSIGITSFNSKVRQYHNTASTSGKANSVEILLETIKEVIEQALLLEDKEGDYILNSISLYIDAYKEQIRKENEEKYYIRYVAYIEEYIRRHYQEEISFSRLADNLHLSRNYLSYLFKKETGQSFMNYLINFRIEKAKDLMMKRSLLVCEISEKVGFQDPAYFSRVFKNITGLSPSNYLNFVSEKGCLSYKKVKGI